MQFPQGDTALQLSQNGEDYPLKAERCHKQVVSCPISASGSLPVAHAWHHELGTLLLEKPYLLQLACRRSVMTDRFTVGGGDRIL